MKRRYVALWFRYLATEWFILRKPQHGGHPLVLVTASHGRMVIRSASPEAEAKGIHPGMVLADARAIEPSLIYHDYPPALEEGLLKRIGEWSIRFTPFASVDLPDGLVLDATGCAHLWGGEEAYLTDISKRLRTKGFSVRTAMASTVGAAWALARYGKDATVTEDAKESEAIAPLPPAALRIETEVVQRLQQLGLRTIGELLTIPAPSLRRRFGPTIVLRLRQAVGSAEEPLQPLLVQEPYCERLPCMEPIVTRTGIEMALEQLIAQACTRLQKEGRGLRKAVFRGYRIDGKTTGIEIQTSRATHHTGHLYALFGLKIQQMEPAGGIELFLLQLSNIEEVKPAQEKFWKESAGLLHPSVAQLIDRLSVKMGTHTISRYLPAEHHWPDRALKKSLSLTEDPHTSWRPQKRRPVELLSPPEVIEVTAPVPDYPPMLFRYKGKLHRIVRADGPERIEQEWWIHDAEHRDYYAVEDEEGNRYWIFRSGHYRPEARHQWFLHGFFA